MQIVDHAGVGEPEVSPLLERVTSGNTCFEVSVVPTNSGRLTSGEPYELELRYASAGEGAGEPSNTDSGGE